MRRFISICIVFFLIAGITLYVMIFVVPDMENTQKKTTVIELGTLGLTDEVTAYFVRSEIVYLAERSGEVAYYVDEGIKARKDVKLLEIIQAPVPETTQPGIYADIVERMVTSGVDMKANTAQQTGIVSYYIDGYERLFSPERLDFLTYDEAESATGPAVNVTRNEGDVARAGEPLYKIVDDSIWYLVFWLRLDSGKVAAYVQGDSIRARLPNGDVTGRVSKIVQQDDMWMIITEFDRYYENLAQPRKVIVGVTTEEYNGLIIDNSSITMVDGKPGVFVKKKSGAFEFVPIKIKKSDGIKSAVSDTYFTGEDDKRVATVKNFDEILVDPTLMEP